MLDRIVSYLAHHQTQAPTAPARMRLSDREALALVDELGTDGIAKMRNPELVVTAATALHKAIAEPPPDDLDALAAWGVRWGDASRTFWDAFSGEVVNGVEIIRKAQ
jgi:hypothetical protein